MPDLSHLTDADTDATNAQIASSAPIAGGDTPGFGEAFSAAWNENRYTDGVHADWQAQADFIQQRLDAFRDKTGETLPNPMTTAFGYPTAQQQADAFTLVRNRFAEYAQPRGDSRVPDPDAPQFPSDDEIVQGGAQLRAQAGSQSLDVAQRGGIAAGLGSLAGGLARGSVDPLNIAAMGAIMAAPEAGLVMRALTAAGAFGGAEAADQAMKAGNTLIDPNAQPWSLNQAIGSVAMSAAGGAAFELGAAALKPVIGAAWRRLVATAPDRAAAVPLEAHDAGVVNERAADLDAQNPFATGQSGVAAHNEAVATMDAQIAKGEPPAAPASATEEATARTGDVFTPPAYKLRVAVKMPDGTVRIGEPGQIHADLLSEKEMDDIKMQDQGFVDPQDNFLTRDQGHQLFEEANTKAVAGAAPTANPTENLTGSLPEASNFVGKQAIRVKYELAELGDLVTSHDSDFRENPAYPQELQPRNRGGKPAQEQVFEMAGDLQPERLGISVEGNSGAPIVGPDNVVESGNGRAMALRQVYGKGGDGPYRAFLERQGFDTTGFKQPVLVKRRVTPMTDEEREAFAQAANGSAALRMTPAEQAMSDARHLSADVMGQAERGEVTNVANRNFVRSFVGKLPQGERGGMMTQGGELSSAGVQRIRAAMVARAYGDPAVVARLFEHPDPNIKTIGSALSGAAADWGKMRDAVTAGLLSSAEDITQPLMDAVRMVMRARDAGESVGRMMAQGDAFTSDMTAQAVRLFLKGDGKTFLSKADMTANLQTFAEDLRSGKAKGTDLFGAAAPSADEVLKGTIAASDRKIASLIEAAKSSEAIAKAIESGKQDEALFADLDRNIETGQNRYIRDDGSVGIADAELAAIKSQDALATELRGCWMPMSSAMALDGAI